MANQIEVVMERFGSVKKKTEHEKIKLEDGYHFLCHWYNCPGNNNGICASVLLDNAIHVKHCFCG